MSHVTNARSAPRRRPLPATLVVLLGLFVIAGVWLLVAPRSKAQGTGDNAATVTKGRVLFERGCSSCHGLHGEGTNQAPTLIGVGAAAADFQLTTGRMPLPAPGAEAERRDPIYPPEQIEALSAYVGSLAPGPPIPSIGDQQWNDADLAEGGELFRANCASCHQAAGKGGALTYGKHAPALSEATPVEALEAIRTGPENMPVFSPTQIKDDQAVAIAKYVQFVTNPPDPGGAGLGHLGPIPEGLVIWLIGMTGVAAAALWIGSRQA